MPGGHLPDERLAELADGGRATRPEDVHLEGCAGCRAELAAIAAIVTGARLERDRVGRALTDWGRLVGALRAEGLVAAEPAGVGAIALGGAEAEGQGGAGVVPVDLASHRAARRLRTRPATWAWRGAAAVLLMAVGVGAGRWSAGAELLPTSRVALATPASRAAAILADSAAAPTSDEEALAVLTRAERDYRTATAFLAGGNAAELVVDRPEVYRRRLAVMDEVASLTNAALSESPHDPVLNQYYLASLGVREATLRSLASALPTGAQLSRF